ncbi:MAG: DUF4157 domain-containing protein, partial [Thiobacillus sp.]
MHEFDRVSRVAERRPDEVEHVTASLTIQRRLRVGASNDPAEVEADRTAASVVAALQSGGGTEGRELGGSKFAVAAGTRIRRQTSAGDRSIPKFRAASPANRIQRRAPIGAEGGEVTPNVEQRIRRMQGQGRALDEPARRSMESAFGADFSSVRIHAGAESRELNHELGAEAFTSGKDIFFRDAVPDGSTKQGQSLLAHELTHTIQQGASASRTVRRKKADDVATLVSAKLNCAVRDDPTIKGHSMSFDLTLSIPGK